MTWSKYHAAARYNLASSGIPGCDLNELPLELHDIAFNGPNHEGYVPLKEAIAATYGVTVDQVVTAQGTSMANFLALATLLERADEVLIERPTYEPLLAALSYLGADVKRFERPFCDGYQIDVGAVKRMTTSRTRLIVITNPHNPSGVAAEWSRLQQLGEFARSVGAYILVDEVYRDVSIGDVPLSHAHLGPNFIATSSLTKSYGLSGLRCGWMLCNPKLAERARRLNDLFTVAGSMPSDAVAVVAFRHLQTLAARACAIVEPNRDLVQRFMGEHDDVVDCVVPPASMIVFPRLKAHSDSGALHELLRQFETSIVPGRFFEAPRHFRLGFAAKTEDVAMGLRNVSMALHALG